MVYKALKRLLDITASLLGTAVLAPLMVLLALLVKTTSSGPAIFIQDRVGQNGRVFRIYKFRTMHVGDDSHKWSGLDPARFRSLVFHQPTDPRVTRLGAFMRRTSLDELPQLFNILRGDMSLVGPRPELPELVAYYDTPARRRLHVPPGLTGLAQISGRSDLSMEQKLALDLEYVDKATFCLDLSILARTVSYVLTGRGAR